MGRPPRRNLRQRQRATHRTLNSGGHRYDSVEAFAPIATFTCAGHEFMIALPAATIFGSEPVGEEMPLSLVMDNRQSHPVEVAKFWLEREHNRTVLEWTVAVRDTDWDLEADQQPLQAATTACCLAMFAGRPIDPALGIRFSAHLAMTARDQHGNLFALNLGGSNG